MEAKHVGMEWRGRKGGFHRQPGTTAGGSEGCERARGVLEERVQRGWVTGEQIVETGTHIRVKGAVNNHVLNSLNASTAVWVQPLLAWHSLPAARFFGTPVGAGAPLRKCLTAAPLARVCDKSRWRGQAGGIKRASVHA